MTISEFNTLEEQERYNVTFKQGTFIEYRLNGKQRFVLYAVYKFFVEVEYNIAENKIKNLKSFEEGMLLSKYAFFRLPD